MIPSPAFTGIKTYAGFGMLASATAAGVSSRQLWLQSLPPDQVPACGPPLVYLIDVFPLTEALRMVLEGDGDCAEVVWSFLGISISGWTLVGFFGLIAILSISRIIVSFIISEIPLRHFLASPDRCYHQLNPIWQILHAHFR